MFWVYKFRTSRVHYDKSHKFENGESMKHSYTYAHGVSCPNNKTRRNTYQCDGGKQALRENCAGTNSQSMIRNFLFERLYYSIPPNAFLIPLRAITSLLSLAIRHPNVRCLNDLPYRSRSLR
ncbi:hypothetical protein I7I53_06804 [Histoplasma capsulatum var. duboisii H88]|uniref:Uncharacterized protein n=1 Tax=Ajellomyces capsulatus (strain H88) TaxID=544711 RepID=A0A8A1LGA1_AJEC8|nr:hypothetical protein I7I53_06804 [Histoplasma capsulatum var. duboisii H88]